jgi:hypothetical protein
MFFRKNDFFFQFFCVMSLKNKKVLKPAAIKTRKIKTKVVRAPYVTCGKSSTAGSSSASGALLQKSENHLKHRPLSIKEKVYFEAIKAIKSLNLKRQRLLNDKNHEIQKLDFTDSILSSLEADVSQLQKLAVEEDTLVLKIRFVGIFYFFI